MAAFSTFTIDHGMLTAPGTCSEGEMPSVVAAAAEPKNLSLNILRRRSSLLHSVVVVNLFFFVFLFCFSVANALQPLRLLSHAWLKLVSVTRCGYTDKAQDRRGFPCRPASARVCEKYFRLATHPPEDLRRPSRVR